MPENAETWFLPANCSTNCQFSGLQSVHDLHQGIGEKGNSLFLLPFLQENSPGLLEGRERADIIKGKGYLPAIFVVLGTKGMPS